LTRFSAQIVPHDAKHAITEQIKITHSW